MLIADINAVLANNKIDAEMIIVDDNSLDGTGVIALEMEKYYRNLRVFIRREARGLGAAVCKGFEIAKGDIVLVMDGDFSHPPAVIPSLVEPIKNGDCDIVIGSRYVFGGGVRDLPLKRRLISAVTAKIAKKFVKVEDVFSGFFAFRKDVINSVRLNPKGQKIGFEIIWKGNYKRLLEVPYEYRGRKLGRSKFNAKVMIENTLHFLRLIIPGFRER